MKQKFIRNLYEENEKIWRSNKSGIFYSFIRSHKISKEFYHALMSEIYKYVLRNPINQAAACINIPDHVNRNAMLKYILKHSTEELGHENMIVRDLKSINILDMSKLEEPALPATEALIGYLESVPQRYGAVARLGYSFWAEDAYDHIREVTTKIRRDLSLNDSNMSFFVAHEKIDKHHSAQVVDAINQFCVTSDDRAQILTVARTTLYLTGKMLDGIAENYLNAA